MGYPEITVAGFYFLFTEPFQEFGGERVDARNGCREIHREVHSTGEWEDKKREEGGGCDDGCAWRQCGRQERPVERFLCLVLVSPRI